jgi:phosphoadenosine phosphosulfate reductase
MELSRRFGESQAPFFIVDSGDRQVSYSSVLHLMRELTEAPAPPTATPASLDVDRARRELSGATPQAILRLALSHFGADCGLAFSGAEDVVLLDMAARIGLPFHAFCLDTGRLHAETYAFIERVRTHYAIEIELTAPETTSLQAFVRKKGLFSFYEDGHKECCGIRKVEPLRRALGGLKAWATGQRKDQNPDTRAEVPVVENDLAFNGSGDAPLVKFNPLANWSSQQTWSYIREHAVPFNPLHERGFVSIGCEPCTRAIHPGQQEREGRWWWEAATQKECGLHNSQVPPKP